MPTKVQSLVLRAPGIHGLNLEGEQIQAQPTFARIANNVAFDSAGRLGNRKGFSSTSSKYNITLGANPITPAAATAADDDGIAVAARPVTTFTLVIYKDTILFFPKLFFYKLVQNLRYLQFSFYVSFMRVFVTYKYFLFII